MGQQRLFPVRQLVILLMLFGLVQVGLGANHFQQGFETTSTPSGWTADTMYYNSTANHGTYTGNYGAGFNASSDWLQTVAVNTAGILTFWIKGSSSPSQIGMKIQKSYNGSDWTDVTTYTKATFTTTWEEKNINIDDLNITIYIRFYIHDRSGNSLYLDDIQLTDYSAGTVNNPTSFALEYATSDQISLTWTAPSSTYDNVLVFGRSGSAVDHSPSGAGSGYSNANAAWGSAGDHDNSKLLYSGTGTSLTVTELTDGTTYYFKAYAYDDSDWSSGTSNINDVAEVQEVSSLAASTANAQSELTWTNYSGAVTTWWDQVIILAKSGSAVDATPTGDPSGYTANATFGSGTQVGTGNYVVYKSTGTSQTVTGLTNGTTYHFKAFVYYLDSGSGHDYSDGTTASYIMPNSWINEIHYDNNGADENEGIEVVIENPSNYTLSNFTVTLYNGNGGASYDSETLDNFTSGNTEGNFTLYYNTASWGNGIQNGPDGIALDYDGSLIQFLSYEGSFAATNGVANGITSTDINVSETASTTSLQSLQLTGNGTAYSDFSWTANLTQTWGTQNNGGDQSLPVELNYFKGVSHDGMVVLNWLTESEIDNLGFLLERRAESREHRVWESLADYKTNAALTGQGSVTHRTEYKYTDEKVRVGQTYEYLLVDVDYYGKETRHDPVSVTVCARGITMKSAYPNPFNPVTKFTVIVGDPQHLTINVYDITGRLVKTLTNERVPAGEHIIAWDGTNSSNQTAASGIYFVRLVANGTTNLQKVVLTR